MNNNSIPAIAYGFVGITALVLTYVTLADTGPVNNESTTSMLPVVDIFNPVKEAATEPIEEEYVTEPEPEVKKEEPIVGGQNKKKKGKKSKMKKGKNKNKTIKTR